jgi:hypothetical protein
MIRSSSAPALSGLDPWPNRCAPESAAAVCDTKPSAEPYELIPDQYEFVPEPGELTPEHEFVPEQYVFIPDESEAREGGPPEWPPESLEATFVAARSGVLLVLPPVAPVMASEPALGIFSLHSAFG